MNISTEMLHIRVDDREAHPSVTPIYQCSAFSADSAFFYSRKANPNVTELEQVVAALENSEYALAYATGMSAIYMVLELLKPGGSLVINKYIYGCSYKLFQRYAKRIGAQLTILDLTTKEGLRKLPPAVDMVIFETPTNPFLKDIDIHDVSEAVKKVNPQALVVVDNTWATPLFQKPLMFGADISLYSATKYFSGHSDVMGGLVLVNDHELHNRLLEGRFYSGSILTPHSAWLLRRSMQTFSLRMEKHSSTTALMLSYLQSLPFIEHVYFPNIDGKQLLGYGGIVFVDIRADLVEHYKVFTSALRWFGTGTGMACVTSMVAQPFSGSHASMSDQEKAEMGIGKGLVRLCFGLEDLEDLKEDLLQAFQTMESRVGVESVLDPA
ncbi:PLP-dependent transferase [Pseudomonas yamanorum]|jgi:cystathionine gamma-lyase/cystathionine gamma-lyase/homocysteine desulfhydrase|uniref:PLP-dependent transferase n=1 Tax=Pseudomonas yamanorum TaxID=515393 RepID=A0AAJ3LG93_9PSED|nr:PLP-dependent transferase [Pseudomonas yamanorum]NWD41936.1 PLP-dependent transferase [Pseudomonas yamanorum]